MTTVDPDKPMTTYRVDVLLETQMPREALTELVYHWLDAPGIGCAGFDLKEER